MGRPKGSGKKHAEEAQEAVHGTETPKVDIAPAEGQERAEIDRAMLPYDSWIYSETEPPIILKAGTPRPEGYSADRASIKQFWLMDDQGKFKKG